MEQRNLGRSGLIVSAVGLGLQQFRRPHGHGGDAARSCTRRSIVGITFFDTSDTYGGRGSSEEYLGRALAGRRHEIVLATKFARPMDREGRLQGASRRYIMSAVEASLRRLSTDYIDLYQQHIADPRTPIEETLRALDDLVRQGKVRYIASSTLSAWQVVEARWTSVHHGLDAIHRVPGALQPAAARPRPRADAGHRILWSGADPVLAAGRRAIDRQIPARRGAAGRHALRDGEQYVL